MKVFLTTRRNGDCGMAITEKGAMALYGYGLIQIGPYVVDSGKLPQPPYEMFRRLRSILSKDTEYGGTPPMAAQYESDFWAEYSGELPAEYEHHFRTWDEWRAIAEPLNRSRPPALPQAGATHQHPAQPAATSAGRGDHYGQPTRTLGK